LFDGHDSNSFIAGLVQAQPALGTFLYQGTAKFLAAYLEAFRAWVQRLTA
jgi:hypothetical protein